MFTYRNSLLLTVVACALVTGPTLVDGQSSHPQRDPRLLDVLSRVIAASGGPQVLASVRDVTESGEITFWADKPGRSPVSIRLLGGHHFRMEADGPEGKRTWVVKNGVGSLREADGEVHSISYDNAVNLGNLTFPLSHFATALSDVRTDVSLLGIENREGRSVYRLRVRGELGLKERKAGPDIPVAKDLVIDAISFDILSVEDRPFPTYEPNGKLSEKPSRTIEFGEFRTVNGMRVPFRITTRLMGQQTLSIQLTSVTFNNNLVDQDFDN